MAISVEYTEEAICKNDPIAETILFACATLDGGIKMQGNASVEEIILKLYPLDPEGFERGLDAIEALVEEGPIPKH